MAHSMRHRGLAALRADDRIDRAQRVMGTTLVALGTGRTTLGCLHGWLLSSVWNFFNDSIGLPPCGKPVSGAIDFERAQNRETGIVESRFACAAVKVAIGPAVRT
jgi:hypothetical protein